MLIRVNPETLKKKLDAAFSVAKPDNVLTQLAKMGSDLFYAREMEAEYVLLTPEEVRLVTELIPLEGMEQKA